MFRIAAIVASMIVAGLPALAAGIDLTKEYPASLDWAEGAIGRPWTCEAGDVWSLASFTYALGDELKVKVAAADVVFGKHGTNVVWAVVLPEAPGKLRSSASEEGERVASIWLRFNPALVGELFPPETVLGKGSPDRLVWAKRVCAWKMNGSWQADNLPVIPYKKSIVLDVETVADPRRFLMVDTQAETVKYEPWFAGRKLPDVVEIDEAAALAAFENVWRAFDAEYAMFGLKPHVDWAKLRGEFRLRVTRAKTSYEVGAVLAEMLAKLEDLHIWVRVGQEYVPCFYRPRPLNASWKAAQKLIGKLEEMPRTLTWGRTPDDIGYINAYTLGNPIVAADFDEVLRKLAETRGLIVDLRYNGGGDETLGQRMAGRFVDRERVYSYSQWRNGPKHTDLGEKIAREFQPRGPSRYESPVVVLIGQRTMSSAESLVHMLACCPQVVTMGDRTAGSSGNPRVVEAGAGITVSLPRWLDLGPDGKPLDTVGIQPKIRVPARPEDFTDEKDPVLQAALQHLRKLPGKGG